MGINCPACENKLSKVLVNGVIVDVCQGGCAGIWLDSKELGKIKECSDETEILFNLKRNPDLRVESQKTRTCPVCIGQNLVKKTYFDKVKIDECRKCGGMWLDASELSYFLDCGCTVKDYSESNEAIKNLRKLLIK